jgi:hypothetical protein
VILESPFYYRYNAHFSVELTGFDFFFGNIFFAFCFKKMSSGSSQRKVRQRTEEGIAATRARMENRQVILDRNILRVDITVAPLNFIAQMIQDNHSGYLYSCACSVYPKLVRVFYGHLEVIQDDISGIILHTRVWEHIIQIDHQLISSIVDVPVCAISASPFTKILEPPSLEHIMDFFDAHP